MESYANFLKEKRASTARRKLLLAQFFELKDPRKLDGLLLSAEELEKKKAIKRKYRDASKLKPVINVPQNDDQEQIFKDSSAFLKGTQSENPHNDYCQNFIDSGDRPQNFIRDVGLKNRFEEYPKLRELITKKDALIQQTNTPPMYLKCDLQTFDLRELDQKFDVILLEPPLEEYQHKLGSSYDKYWNWDEIEKLQLEHIAAPRSFIWMWCGSSDGLDAGRRCLKKWGYRRCEDICWIETNKECRGDKRIEPKAIFQRTKEHCLMGIKGTVRRSTDGDFIHANVDIDLIIDEQPRDGSDERPVEIFHIIEHFCLGRRRLHLFGGDTSIRPGWLTIGPKLTSTNYDRESYNANFTKKPDGHLTGCTEDIERLRPKSPPPKNGHQTQLRNSNNNSGIIPPALPTHGMMGPPSMVNSGVMVPMIAAMIRNNGPQIPSQRHVLYQPHSIVRANSWNPRPVNMAPNVGVVGNQWMQPISNIQQPSYNSFATTTPPSFHLHR